MDRRIIPKASIEHEESYVARRRRYPWLHNILSIELVTQDLTLENAVRLVDNYLKCQTCRLSKGSIRDTILHYRDILDNRYPSNRAAKQRAELREFGYMFPPNNGVAYTNIMRLFLALHEMMMDLSNGSIKLVASYTNVVEEMNSWRCLINPYSMLLRDVPTEERKIDIRDRTRQQLTKALTSRGIRESIRIVDCMVDCYITECHDMGLTTDSTILSAISGMISRRYT